MKKIILIILFCGVGKLFAQYTNSNTYNSRSGNAVSNNNRVNNNTKPAPVVENVYNEQIHLKDSLEEIEADILPYKSEPKIKNDRYYFWYLNKVIHSTQGGYSGQLLNGHYLAFYPDKNLKEDGNFKTGLKDGIWKTWNPKGDLTGVTTWEDGIEVPNDQSIWKKIPFINKKDAPPAGSKPTGNQ